MEGTRVYLFLSKSLLRNANRRSQFDDISLWGKKTFLLSQPARRQETRLQSVSLIEGLGGFKGSGKGGLVYWGAGGADSNCRASGLIYLDSRPSASERIPVISSSHVPALQLRGCVCVWVCVCQRERLVKTQIAGCYPQNLWFSKFREGSKTTFLICFQTMLIILDQRLHCERTTNLDHLTQILDFLYTATLYPINHAPRSVHSLSHCTTDISLILWNTIFQEIFSIKYTLLVYLSNFVLWIWTIV